MLKRKLSLVVLLLLVASCAKGPRHAAIVADNTLYEALNAAFETEQIVLHNNTPNWTLAQSQAFNKKLLPAVSAGREFNKIISNWKGGMPIPAELHDAIVGVQTSLDQVINDFPYSLAKVDIINNLHKAEKILLNTLDLYLTFKK